MPATINDRLKRNFEQLLQFGEAAREPDGASLYFFYQEKEKKTVDMQLPQIFEYYLPHSSLLTPIISLAFCNTAFDGFSPASMFAIASTRSALFNNRIWVCTIPFVSFLYTK